MSCTLSKWVGPKNDPQICCFLLNNPSIVQISVNGTLFAKFKHRIKPEEITHLRLYGDIEPLKLEYTSKKGMHWLYAKKTALFRTILKSGQSKKGEKLNFPEK